MRKRSTNGRRHGERPGRRHGAGWRFQGALLVAASLLAPAAGGAAGSEPLALTLDEAIEIGLAQNKQLAIADARVDAAGARLGQARSAFLPAIGASASYTKLDQVPFIDASGFGDMFAPLMVPFQDLVDNGYLDESALDGLSGTGGDKIYVGDDDVYTIGVSVRQPVFTGGGILGAYGAAKHASRAEEWNRERQEDRTRYSVTEAYLGLVRADAGLLVMSDAVGQMESYVSDLETLFEVGMILEKDLMAARVRLSSTRLGLNRAEHGVRLAMAGLAFQMGIDVDTEIDALDPLEAGTSAETNVQTHVGVGLRERPDLRAMVETVGAASSAESAARSEYFPQLVFVGNYNWDRPNREYEPKFYEHWSATLALQMNVFDWGGRSGRIKESKSRRLEAESALAMMEDAVRLEITQASLAYDEASSAVSIAEAGVAQARESMRVTRESFRNGMSTNTEFLNAQQALTVAELARVSSQTDLKLAEARLELATGVVTP
jgi:outer membrane protein